MKHNKPSTQRLLAACFFSTTTQLPCLHVASADIITTGDIETYFSVGNPMLNLDIEGNFTTHGRPRIGVTTDGTLLVNNTSHLQTGSAILGAYFGGHGTATITGPSSTWTIHEIDASDSFLFVGTYGYGQLTIADGATVNNWDGLTQVDPNNHAPESHIQFNNGTLNTGTIKGALDHFKGSGTINTLGMTNNLNHLSLNASTGVSWSEQLSSNPESPLTLNVSFSGENGVGDLTIGENAENGEGSLSLDGNIQPHNKTVTLGHQANNHVVANMTNGVQWHIQNLNIGQIGTTDLLIGSGSTVSVSGTTSLSQITPGSTLHVTGDQSQLNTPSLVIAESDQANDPRHANTSLTISNGGQVTTDYFLNLAKASHLLIQDENSQLTATTGARIYGNMAILDGGTLSTEDTDLFADTNISGIGSEWINRDRIVARNGTITVADGGKLTTKSLVSYREDNGLDLIVRGPASLFEAKQTALNQVNVKEGATFQTDNLGIGTRDSLGTANALIEGPETTLWAERTTLGSQKNTNMQIAQGAEANLSILYMGDYNAHAQLTISGENTVANSTDFHLENNHGNSVTISEHAILNVSGTLHGRYLGQPQGRLILSNGTLKTDTLAINQSQLHGIGRIETNHIEGDFNLVFDDPNASTATYTISDLPSESISLQTQLFDPTAMSRIHLGISESSSLRLLNGVEIWTSNAEFGSNPEYKSTVNLAGEGTAWHESGNFYIGKTANSNSSQTTEKSLTVLDSASLDVAQLLQIGNQTSGSLFIDGGKVSASSAHLHASTNNPTIIQGEGGALNVSQYVQSTSGIQISNKGQLNTNTLTMATGDQNANIDLHGNGSLLSVEKLQFGTSALSHNRLSITQGAKADIGSLVATTPSEIATQVDILGENTIANFGAIDYQNKRKLNLNVAEGATLNINTLSLLSDSSLNVSDTGSIANITNFSGLPQDGVQFNIAHGAIVQVDNAFRYSSTWAYNPEENASMITLDQGTLKTNQFELFGQSISGTGSIHTTGTTRMDNIDLRFDQNAQGIGVANLSHEPTQNIDFVYDWSGPEKTSINRFGFNGTTNIVVEDGNDLALYELMLGSGNGHSTHLSLNGSDTTLQTSRFLLMPSHLPADGSITLEVNDGAQLISDHSDIEWFGREGTFNAHIQGAGSTWKTAGNLDFTDTNTQFTISNQGMLEVQGTLTADDNTFTLDNGTIKTGYFEADPTTLQGSGNLITAGLSGIGNLDLFFNEDQPSTSNYNLPNPNIHATLDLSQWGNMAKLSLGHGGASSLRVENGGDIHTGDTTLGATENSSVSATITGTQANWQINGDLEVGKHGSARLSVSQGATINTQQTTIGGNGRIDIGSDSQWENFGTFNIEDGGSLYLMSDATLSTTGGIRIESNETNPSRLVIRVGNLDLHGNGILQSGSSSESALTFTGGTIQNPGRIEAGDAFTQHGGLLSIKRPDRFTPFGNGTTIEGDYILKHGTLELGYQPFSQIVLNVSGTLDLVGDDNRADATLVIDPSFATRLFPQTLIQAEDIAGVFANVDGIQINDSLSWAVTYTDTNVFMQAATPGDINLDGVVDLDDLTILGTFYGESGTWAMGDIDGSGDVGLDDLTILGTFYNSESVTFQQALQSTGLANVPEPASALTLAMGIMGLVSRRRRAS